MTQRDSMCNRKTQKFRLTLSLEILQQNVFNQLSDKHSCMAVYCMKNPLLLVHITNRSFVVFFSGTLKTQKKAHGLVQHTPVQLYC